MAESAAERLAYVQTNEVKLIRRKHRIGFRPGLERGLLSQKLTAVPCNAIVDEIEEHEDGVVTITFHEETRVK